MSDNLVIHPDRFEDMAMSITNNLMTLRVICDDDYSKSVATIMRTLQHQLFLHKNWTAEDVDAVKRFKADRPDNLPQDGSTAI